MSVSAYKVFTKTMKRADGLLALHPELHGTTGRPQQHVSDILRGALILATAALDALVLDSIAEAIPMLAKAGELGEDITKWVKDDPRPVLEAFSKRNPTKTLADFCRQRLGTQTFQRSAAIEGILRGTIGSEAPWQRAAETLSDEVEWSVQDVKDQLDTFVERRNRIVHGGDMKPGTTSTVGIRRKYVQRALSVIAAVGSATDSVVKERLRAIGKS